MLHINKEVDASNAIQFNLISPLFFQFHTNISTLQKKDFQ